MSGATYVVARCQLSIAIVNCLVQIIFQQIATFFFNFDARLRRLFALNLLFQLVILVDHSRSSREARSKQNPFSTVSHFSS